MTDAQGLTPYDEAFYIPNAETWIQLDPVTTTIKTQKNGDEIRTKYMYRKVANGHPQNIVVSSQFDCGAPGWRKWREIETGTSWAEIAKGYEGMAKKC